MNEFYDLMNKGMRGEAVCFPRIPLSEWNDSLILRNQGLPNKQVIYTPCLGKKFFDFNTVSPALNLISERVFNMLMENNITGWKGIPAVIYKHEDLKYYLLTITGRCGPIDKSKTIVVDSTTFIPGKTTRMYQGLFFSEDSWDGSDMFVSEYVNYTFITEKVKNLFKKNKVTNIIITNIKEHQRLCY